MPQTYAKADFWTRAEVFTRARDLAFSILPIDEVATEVALEAMHGAQLCLNKKRHHKENYKYKKYGPTRVLLEENQLVQAYVYRESEKYEKYSEGDSNQKLNPALADLIKQVPLSEENLVVRYLKFLIQISHDNSVNAVLVMTKLIYSYSTRDAAEIYMHLHSDAPEENYFSKRKWEFMRRLEERFDTLIARGVLTVCIGKKREKYFQGQESPNSCWVDVAAEYLKLFTPWGTPCLLAETQGSLMEKFFERLQEIFSKDKRELNCIHTTLCPDCCARLMQDLNLPAPSQLLTLPRFDLDKKGDRPMNGGSPRQHPGKERSEVENALKILDHEAVRRKRAALAGIKRLSITVDNEAEMALDLSATSVQFSIDEKVLGSSRLIKFYGEDEEGALLLATALLNRRDLQPPLFRRLLGPKRYRLLEGEQRIELAIAYCEGADGAGRFTFEIGCSCGIDERQSSLSFPSPMLLSSRQAALAAVLLTLTVIWLIVNNGPRYPQVEKREIELNTQPAQSPPRPETDRKVLEHRGPEITALKRPRPAVTTLVLDPDLDIARGSSAGPTAVKRLIIPAQAARIQLQLNFQSRERYQSYRAALAFVREANPVWSKDRLRARPYRDGRSIILEIPATIFSAGDYRITLRGLIADLAEEEEIDAYTFTVVKP